MLFYEIRLKLRHLEPEIIDNEIIKNCQNQNYMDFWDFYQKNLFKCCCKITHGVDTANS